MAKKSRHLCSRCEQKLHEGKAFCGSCGYPTPWASHDEKVDWELEQYERARQDGTHADFERLQSAPVPTRRASRRGRSRPVEPVVEPVISVREFREQRAGDVAVVRHADSAPSRRTEAASARPAATPPRAAMPPLPAADDTAVLVKVMRLLNARISELESRIAELEGERAPARRASGAE